MIQSVSIYWAINIAIVVILISFTIYSTLFILKNNRNAKSRGTTTPNLLVQKTIIVVAFLVTLTGLFISNKKAKDKDIQIRNDLVTTASKITQGINPIDFYSISFTPLDVKTYNFICITEQLQIAAKSFNYAEIFTVKQKDTVYVYGPSSMYSDTTTSHNPGAVFHGSTDIIEDIYHGGEYETYGPYYDGINYVITGFSSVLNSRSTIPSFVIGVNITQKEWQNQVIKARLLPHIVILVLLILLWGSFLILSGYRKNERSYTIWWKSPEAILTMTLCLIITAIISISIISIEKEFRKTIFNQMSAVQVSQIQRYYIGNDNWIRTVALSIQKKIKKEEDYSEFKDLSYQLLKSSYVIKTGLVILDETNEDVDPIPVIKTIEPSSEFPFIKGNKFPSLTNETAELIFESTQSGLRSFDGPFYMPLGPKETASLYYPIKLNGSKKNNGLLFIIIDPNLLLSEAIAVQGPNKEFFIISQINGHINKTDTKTIATYPLNSYKQQELNSTLETVYPQLFWGRTFNYSFKDGEIFKKTHPAIASKYSTIIGIILSILLSSFVGIISTRKANLKLEVEKQTLKLRISETRFAELFSSMTEGVSLHEIIRNENQEIIDFRIIETNPVFLNLWNIDKPDIIGKNISALNDKIPITLNELISVFSTKTPLQKEYFYQPLNRFFHISFTSWNENGIAAIYSDITNRKNAERDLIKSEERYKLIADNVADVIWVYNCKNEKITFISPSVNKVLGYKTEEFCNMKLMDYFTPESYNLINTLIPGKIREFETGENRTPVIVNSLKQIKKNGQIIDTEIVSTLISDSEGKVTEILGVTHDITEKILATKALKESEEKYRLLVENQQDLITKTDKYGKLLYASHSFCRTFGKKEEDLIGKIFVPQIHKEDIEHSFKALAELPNPPHKVSFEQRVYTVNGWRWLSWQNNALFENNSQIGGYIGVARDITKQKEYEQQIEENRKELQKQNEEYAMLNEEYMALNEELQCTNEELVQAIDKASESENLKTAFLQNMSHEIRTPLNAVIGFSELLSFPDISNEDKKNYTELIINSSRQLLNLVNDILTISTLETRQEKINFEAIPLNFIMKELESVFLPKAIAKGICLEAVIQKGDDKQFIETDEMKLKQVLNNLIGNAVKFTSKGYVKFGYKTINNKVQFFVEDTGIGIPKDSLELVFERFRQAQNNNTSVHGGTGLGLAISKGHVELMGGKIWVESVQSKGSIFYFELPISTEVNA